MKSIIKDFAQACYALLFLISTKALAQEKLQITPDLTKKLIEEHNLGKFNVYPVSYKEVEYHTSDTTIATKKDYKYALEMIEKYKGFINATYSFEYKQYKDYTAKLEQLKKDISEQTANDKILKRLAYMIDGSPIDVNSLSGEFTKLPDPYIRIYNEDTNVLKNELIAKPGYNENKDDLHPIIRKNDTQQLYFVISTSYISYLIKEYSDREMLDIVHKLGYKEYTDGGEMYIKSKTSEIRLDIRTFQELESNPNYITQLDNDQIKIASLVKQTIIHSKTLDRYLSLYNIKKGKMATMDIKAWRTATTNAQKLNDQIYKLNEKYEGNYSFTLINKSNTLDMFLDNLNASKGVLRM